MSVVPRVLASSVVLLSFLLLPAGTGCRKKRPVEDARKPAYTVVNGVDVWINRSPPERRFEVLTTEDPTVRLDAAGQRALRMRGDAAVMEAAARRAKAIGADAVLMVTTGPAATRKLSPMTMFVRYEGGATSGAPTTAPAVGS
jgi:hypothetical protein